MAAITGRNIVVDPRVKGTITLSTESRCRPASPTTSSWPRCASRASPSSNRAGLLKVVPKPDAKLQGGTVSVGTPAAGNQIVTQIFRLNYETAGNLVPSCVR
jgi:general secretion pathway protein D